MKCMKQLLLMLCLAFAIKTQGQSTSFSDVVDVKLQNSVTIMNNKDVVGYALLYKLEKQKKAALYRLEVLDENLKPIGNNEFEAGKSLEMESAVYESGSIMLAMRDPSKKAEYNRYSMTFDLKGKQTGTVGYEPEEGKKGMYGAAVAQSMEDFYNGFANAEGKGFVSVYQNELKTGGAEVRMIGTNGKLKWSKNFTAEKGDRMDIYLLEATGNTVILSQMDRANIMKKDGEMYILGLDANSGKQLYKKSMNFNGYTYEPYLFKKNAAGETRMVSFLSSEDAKFASARIIGFNIATLNDKTGELTNSKNYLYDTDLNGVLDMKTESKSEEGFLRIHDLNLMKDGTTVVVGEFFRRTVSALGAASKILSAAGGSVGGGAASQMTIGDMFLMRLDKSGKVKTLEKIEKGKDRIALPADGISLGLIARWLAINRYFGYSYTDESNDEGKVTVIAGGDFEGENYATAAITFDENKGYKIKKFTSVREKGQKIYIQRGKPGHVLVLKYNNKKNEISLNLEKMY